MRLTQQRSGNVIDLRGRRGVAAGVGGLGVLGTLGLLAVSLFLGIDPRQLMGAPAAEPSYSTYEETDPPTDQAGDFVSAVLADTETTWGRELHRQAGIGYREPRLVLFSGAVQSACGLESSATGPFYCPLDGQVYLDTSFFDELSARFGAPGDFAAAYVIAHEVGHHVQALLGTSERAREWQARASSAEANAVSVRVELQADCYAGVWAHYARRERDVLEPGDLEEGLGAAAAVGDDRLQMSARGYVAPESFTHGTSAQRVEWFQRGMASGRIADCDPFGGRL